MMDTFTLKQNATIVELSGYITTKNSQGEVITLVQGDSLEQNKSYEVSADVTFTLQYSDGSTVTQDNVVISPATNDAAQANEPTETELDPEIAALQEQILSGEDPTESLPDTAAGETAQTANEGGGYIAVSRIGDETLANAGHDTAGFKQVELTRVDELPVFLTEFALPRLSARAVTLHEKHLEQGSEPQVTSLSQAESVSVNVQAGIQSLSINGIAVFTSGDFVGPVSITTQYGVLTISSYDAVNSVLTYSYTLVATLDHSDSDTLSEIFLLQLTDNQGVQTTTLVTANIVDDAPSGLDDSNEISQNNLDGVLGNVLQNDTFGADSAAVTQISNSVNSSADIVGNTAISGVYGSLIIAADGSYSYQLNNQLSEIQALALGEQLIETFNYQLTDSDGDFVSQVLSITITGENDAPEITSSFEDALGNVIEAGVLIGGNIEAAGIAQASGTLTADDVDNGAILNWQLDDNPVTPYGVFSLNESTGEWSFILDNELANSLAYGEQLTESFTITVTDEYGLSDTQVITITINGTNDIPFITSNAQDALGSVKEAGVLDDFDNYPDNNNTPAVAVLQTGGTLTADDLDNNASWTWSGDASGTYGEFTIDTDTGEWIYNLNDSALVNALASGEQHEESFTVTVTDEFGATATQEVTVTVNGTNDIPFITSNAQDALGSVKEAGVIDDFDNYPDNNPDNNNTPAVAVLQTGGTLSADDLDNNASWTWSGDASGTYGEFTIDTDTGEWIYNLNDSALVNALASGEQHEESFTVTVTDEFGATATQEVTVTVHGTNDIPFITSNAQDALGSVKEAGVIDDFDNNPDNNPDNNNTPAVAVLQTGGTLSADDLDNNASWTWSGDASGTYGEFTIDTDTGEWIYNLNDSALVNALASGEQHEESFTVTVTDEFGATATQEVTVTVHGTNDIPFITSNAQDALGSVKEAGVFDDFDNYPDNNPDNNNTPAVAVLQTGGTLSADDLDNNASWTWSGNASGTYGEFTVDPDTGEWIYNLNDSALVNALASGEQHEESFTVTVTDEFGATATQEVTVTVHGTNDIPFITSNAQDALGSVKEAGVIDDFDNYPDNNPDNNNTPAVAVLQTGGTLTADDLDNNASWTWSGDASGTYGEFTIDTDTGEWIYNLNDSALVNALASGEQHEESFTVTVTDEFGATATQEVTVTVNGTNDIPFITSNAQDALGSVKEAGVIDDFDNYPDNNPDNNNTPAVAVLQTGGTLTADDLDNNASWTWSGDASGTYGEFTIDTDTGEWIYNLNDSALVNALASGEQHEESFTVTVTDEFGATATQEVTVTVHGTNDIPFITSNAQDALGSVKEAGVIDDFDNNPDNNNTPAVAVLQTGGTLTADDLDNNASWTWSGDASGTYGEFTIDTDTGEWIYNLNDSALVNALASGEQHEESFTVTVTDEFGATATQEVTVTVHGTNDIPELTADTLGGVTEDLNVNNDMISDTGVLSFTDVDNNSTGTMSSLYNTDISWSAGDLNTVLTQAQIDEIISGFSVSQNNWDFSVANSLIQFLAATESITLSFDVTVTDNYGATDTETITLTISGVNDTIEGEFAKEVWVPASLNEITDPYLSGYPLLISQPTDIDINDAITVSNLEITLLTQGLDPDVELGSVYYMADGDNTLSLIDFNAPPVLSATELESLVYVPGDNGDVDYQIDLGLTFQINSGMDSVDGEFIIHAVPANGLADQTVQIGDGSSPLTSGNDQEADLVITELFANALNSDPASGSLQLFTDFQQNPIVIPVPVNERAANTAAGAAREMEVSARLTIGSAIFEVIPDNDGDGIITWSYDADSGLMKAEVDYSAIFLLDGNGDPTTTSLADYIIANPVAANDTWQITYLDNNGGNFQARFVEAVFTHEQIADDSITIVGTDNINNLIFGSTNSDSLTGANLDDRIFGREDNDILIGLSGNDELIGGSGNDNVQGGEGNDFVIGGIGDDTLNGGIGRDYLSGGQGNDSLDGGALNGSDDGERDFFVWESDSADGSTDTVLNFNLDIDVLDLSDLLIGEESGNLEDFLSFSFSGGNTTITIDADGLGVGTDSVMIILDGIDLSSIYGSADASIIIAELIADEALITDPNTTPFIPPYEQVDDGLNLP
ncbi:putative outer membrane adhesin like protein [Shewanella halifaxensis HAW-EB4]|uniref:Outer membrane adhesin like protein n=1 Tax=Shewanella halifaxensis (strain HAW-EB4) TaxID=458817 RepID=B0TJ58_SHEHH|nr:retention module-containing protein [Shewanella halifaxensis]ABZ78461.1 putative outer membrane adhesin like protein [Shewanella halifaxensis HAW-EB4]